MNFLLCFIFRFRSKNVICVWPKMLFLYIKLFQITSYVNDFQTLNNPGSGQPVGALKNQFYPPFLTQILHHHRRRRVVRVNRCAAQ